MANHMRQDDDSCEGRINAEDGFQANQQVIDEGVRVQAVDVPDSAKRSYAPDPTKIERVARSRRAYKQYARRQRHQNRFRGHRHHHHHHHGSGRSTLAKRLGVAFLVLAVILVGVGGVSYVYGKKLINSASVVKEQASQATKEMSTLMSCVSSGDYESAQQSAQSLSTVAGQMSQELSGSEWEFASHIPVYGEDVTKVRTLAASFQDLSDNALIPFTRDLGDAQFAAIVGTEGAINVRALTGVVSSLGTVSDVVDRNTRLVNSLGEAKIQQVNAPLQSTKSMLSDFNDLTQGSLKIAPYLPQMLGADGNTRHYLVVAQSNAEMRATGGFPGSCGVLYVNDGKLDLGDFASFGGLRRDESVWPKLTDEELAAYGDAMQNKFDNLNYSPDFQRVGGLFAEMWQNINGEHIDGTVVIDPVFLQKVLELTGGVTAANGWEIDGTNAAKMLMNTVYVDIEDPDAEDALFADVAQRSFKQLTSNIGHIGLAGVTSMIGDASQSHRLQVWMANPDEEMIMKELGVSGALETDSSKQPVLGVYVNDATWAKMGWYLDLRTQLGESVQNADGTITYRVTTTVHNVISTSDAETLRAWIVGKREDAPTRGSMYTQLSFYPPAGGRVEDLTVSDGSKTWYASIYGFDVGFAHFWTDPEKTTTVTYSVTTASNPSGPLAVRMSPTAQSFE